ncbi:MAG: DEAD/DEAH box helicase, partial [Candidatus Zipacnadales bacterium]
MTLRLRPYQWDAVEQALAALRKHHRVLLTMATGLGKTVVFSEVAKRYAAYGRVLIITHRAELVWQTLRHLEEHFPGIEMRGYAHGSGYSKRRIVVGTIQTVHRRLTRFAPETFSLVVFDEAHHCPAPTWTKVMRTFDGAKVLGVTATPRRTDGTPLYGFETIAFSYPLSAAITDRWLVPVRAMRMHKVTVDLSEATVSAGDYTAESLDRILAEESKLHAIADAALDHADKKVLVFMPSNDSAQRLCDVIERYVPNCAAAITYRQRDEERRA